MLDRYSNPNTPISGNSPNNGTVDWQGQLQRAGQQAVINAQQGDAPAAPIEDYSKTSNTDLANQARTNESQMMDQTDVTNPNLDWKNKIANINPNDPNIDMDWVKGFEASMSRKESNTRLGMDQQKMGAALTDRFEGRALNDGMKQAAQDGGLAGVINFLQTADPEKAMSFYKQKLELDQSIMQNDVMQATIPSMKVKAMAEGYGALGRMGMALINAKPQDRENLYQTMLPMVQQINPNAPKTLDKNAIGMFMLSAAQADPKNQLFNANLNLQTAQSTLGKLSADIEARVKAGHTPENDPNLKAMLAQRDQYSDVATARAIQANTAQLQQDSLKNTKMEKVVSSNETFNNNLLKASHDYIDAMSSYSASKPNIEMLKRDPNNPYAQTALGRLYTLALNKGSLSEADAQIQFAAAGLPQLAKKLQGYLTGEKVVLNNKEQAQLIENFENQMKVRTQRQQTIEDGFKRSIDTNPSYEVINWNGVRKPSDQYWALNPNSGLASGLELNTPESNLGAPVQAIQFLHDNPDTLPGFQQKYGYNPFKE